MMTSWKMLKTETGLYEKCLKNPMTFSTYAKDDWFCRVLRVNGFPWTCVVRM